MEIKYQRKDLERMLNEKNEQLSIYRDTIKGLKAELSTCKEKNCSNCIHFKADPNTQDRGICKNEVITGGVTDALCCCEHKPI